MGQIVGFPDKEIKPLPTDFANTHSAAYWTETISTAWQKTAQGIFDTGTALMRANEELDPQVFQALRLPFGARTKQRLMRIAENGVLATHVSLLPPSWGTLYELTKIPADVLLVLLEDGSIHPGLERKDVVKLRGEHSGENTEASKPAASVTAEPAAPVLMDIWLNAPVEQKRAILDREGRPGLMKVLSPALLAELKDALLGQEVQSATTSTTLAVNLTKILQGALLDNRDADGPLAKLNAKLKANGRGHHDVVVAINTHVKGRRRRD
jgi:hypothetical protein